MANDLSLLSLIVAVPASVLCMTIAARRIGHSLAITLSVAASAICVWYLMQGVETSCAIDESECTGAAGTAYLIGFVWLLAAAVGFMSMYRRSTVE